MPKIYLDNAAATQIDPKVMEVVLSHTKKIYGNPSSIHEVGRKARLVIDNSRKTVADILNASPPEIIFTGSGTESINLSILGVARAYKKYGKHIITTEIEHKAVINSCHQLEKEGFKVTYLKVGKSGVVNLGDLRKTLKKDTILVSIMYANNEIGTIQPISKISKLLRDFRKRTFQVPRFKFHDKRLPIFHTDAIQAAGYLDLNVQKLGVDLMGLNGSKIYGPKGTGCLFVRRGTLLEPLNFGGSQEYGLRPGTEDPGLIAGFAKALEIVSKNKDKESKRLTKLRDYAISKILKDILSSELNGDPVLRLPNNINISFKDVDGEMLVLELDKSGVYVSTGSACTTTETGPSHVLKSLGKKTGDNLRVTLGKHTTKKDIDYFIDVLERSVKKMKS